MSISVKINYLKLLKYLSMKKSSQIIIQIRQTTKVLKAATRSLRRPRGPIMLGPMDDVTPWTEDAMNVKSAKNKIDELTMELGQQVLRERG